MAKIVHVTCVHSAFDTRIFFKECLTLSAAGHEVVLVAPHDKDEVVQGIRIRAISGSDTRLTRMTRTAWEAYEAAVRERADLYHVHDPELLPWTLLLRLRGNAVIYDMHENLPKAVLTKPWIPRKVRASLGLVVRCVERFFLHGMPVVYAETSYARDYKWIRNYVIVLNMPALPQLATMEGKKYSVPTIGYIGGVTAERGSLVTLEALSILKQRGYTVEFECIGPVEVTHRAELTAFIKEHGLEGVHIRGYMLPTEGWQKIARCHVGVAVLKPAPNYIESYPTKMFEYMALGMPVVVSNFPLYASVVEEVRCGICVSPESPMEVADAIQWLLDHPYEAEAMGQRGRRAVLETYNWDVEGKKLLAFYDVLLRRVRRNVP